MKVSVFVIVSIVSCCVFNLTLYAFAPTRKASTVLSPAPNPDNLATLNGFVLDSLSKEPLVGAVVVVKGTKVGARTNKSGYFSVQNVPIGTHTITVSAIGYKKLAAQYSFSARESRKVTFELQSLNTTSQEVVVTAEREVEKRQINVSTVNVPVEQIKNIRIGGEADVFRAVQMLPGVLASSQISSGLYIRGGSPDQNLVLIDGSTVYNPSHLFGFISTFNPEAIKDVELHKGGFPANYGGRMSAVLDLTQKDGNKEKFEGLASLGLISSRASLQGPIGNGSWFISGRRTYLDLLIAAMPVDEQNPLPNFYFYDANAKINQSLGQNDRVFLSGFISKDQLNYDAQGLNFGMGIGNKTGSARWTHVWGDNLFSTVNFGTSNYSNGFSIKQSDFENSINNSISDYTLKADFEWFASNTLTAKVGYEGTWYNFSFEQNFSAEKKSEESDSIKPGNTNLKVSDRTHAMYAHLNYQLDDNLSAQVGMRANYWDSSDVVTYDPRVALRYQLQEGLAVKAAWGVYHQYFRLATLQDFSFFDTWLPNDGSVPASYARHYILSVESRPGDGWEFNLDGYYKELYNVSELRPFQTSSKTVNDVFYNGKGEAYGVELFAQKRIGDFTGWAGYALGWVWSEFAEINGGERFHPKYDRRHDFKIVGNYKINETWEVGGSFTFQSGQPYTLVSSRVMTTLPGESVQKSLNFEANRYAFRLPNSHQLNVNASYHTTIFGLESKLVLDIYNLYSRRDIWFRVFDTQKTVTEVRDIRLLPIIPTISLEVKF